MQYSMNETMPPRKLFHMEDGVVPTVSLHIGHALMQQDGVG